MMGLYNLCRSLDCLPDAGGILDQPADWVEFAVAFANAEAEHNR